MNSLYMISLLFRSWKSMIFMNFIISYSIFLLFSYFFEKKLFKYTFVLIVFQISIENTYNSNPTTK
jgi:hypothetical protein